MGGGKTLFMTLAAIQYHNDNPESPIYANYHLQGISTFEFTPALFLPYNDLEKCLILADDIYAMPNLDNFLSIVVNLSRKSSIDVMLSGQYYTFLKPVIRQVTTYMCEVKYYPEEDLLVVAGEKEGKLFIIRYHNAVKCAKEFYNTNEKVEFITESKLKTQILRFSKNEEDLEVNVTLAFKNKSERRRIMRELLPLV